MPKTKAILLNVPAELYGRLVQLAALDTYRSGQKKTIHTKALEFIELGINRFKPETNGKI